MDSAEDLMKHLTLKQINTLEFQGSSISVGSPNVFGGQVVAQALNAACRTITGGRILHSMHSYFLEPGNLTVPIYYKVDIVRDGGSFSVRRVTALQNDNVIFILSASFHKQEDGYEHHIEIPKSIEQPENLMSWSEMLDKFGDAIPSKTKVYLEMQRPIEFKPVEMVNPFNKQDLSPVTNVWFKLKGETSNLDLASKQQILAYISDYNILAAAMNRHASKAHWGNTQTASLDHSMWFFREFDYQDWLLYRIESPNTSSARGFAMGNIFSRDGTLIASVAQEGLMRPNKKTI